MSNPKSCCGARRTEHPQEQQRQPDMCKVLSYHEILLFETGLSFLPSLTNATIRLFWGHTDKKSRFSRVKVQ